MKNTRKNNNTKKKVEPQKSNVIHFPIRGNFISLKRLEDCPESGLKKGDFMIFRTVFDESEIKPDTEVLFKEEGQYFSTVKRSVPKLATVKGTAVGVRRAA